MGSKGTGKTMMDTLYGLMHDQGYTGKHDTFNSKDYLLPQSRPRVWMVVVRMTPGAKDINVCKRMHRFKCKASVKLESLLERATEAVPTNTRRTINTNSTTINTISRLSIVITNIIVISKIT